MKNIIFSCAFFLIPNLVWSYQAGISAKRYSWETSQTARLRNKNHSETAFSELIQASKNLSAVDSQTPLEDLNLLEVTRVASYAQLMAEFKYIRDTRFLETNRTDFPRRITWLYPDDGCFARAEMATIKLEEHSFSSPKKFFAFGDLFAYTNNTPSGTVEWWYHVAVAYRVNDQVYIFDPAIEIKRPLPLDEWIFSIGGNKASLQFAICSAETYDADSVCLGSNGISKQRAQREQMSFLSFELDRILELNRSPDVYLGENPPWLEQP